MHIYVYLCSEAAGQHSCSPNLLRDIWQAAPVTSFTAELWG